MGIRKFIRLVKTKFRFKVSYNDAYMNEMEAPEVIKENTLKELKNSKLNK